MILLMMHIGLGGMVAALGALAGGLVLIALRIFLSAHARALQAERIRQIGIVGAVKQALFEVDQPELDFPSHKPIAG